MDNKDLIYKIRTVLAREDGMPELFEFGADGSNRRFYRYRSGEFSCIAALPGEGNTKNLQEAYSAFIIGSHLFNRKIAVPELYGYDRQTGLVLYEDLGGTHLYDVVTNNDTVQNNERIKSLYGQVLEELAEMQVEGKKGFDEKWCWDTSCYDKELMLEKESRYFQRCCWQNLLGKKYVEGLQEDFENLTESALVDNSRYFLHRDFQSRNIMICAGNVRFIDFQGGRLGPLGYDVASLLIDPYTSLSTQLQEELLEQYIEYIGRRTVLNTSLFRKSYAALALQRNLQFIGAFCYLGLECEKTFFVQYIRPALESLNRLLTSKHAPELPVLKDVASLALYDLPEDI